MVSAISSGWKSLHSLPGHLNWLLCANKKHSRPLDFWNKCYKTIQQQSLDNQGSTVMLNPFALKGRTILVDRHLPF